MPESEHERAVVDILATLSVGAVETIEQHPTGTVVPDARGSEPSAQRIVELVEHLNQGRSVSLELHETLGEGGMGVVRLGTQSSLGRAVAVKTLKGSHRSRDFVLKLMREAWVTGHLEHPNIVPVYDVTLDDDEGPLVVLKRIEGDEWASLLRDPDSVKRRFGVEDLFDWNVGILLQLCNAVRFAHDRGVLHRDLKPENVMIGAFGEVYLVDWGIALSLEKERFPWLPLASEAREMAGTPVYMAPEMLGQSSLPLSEMTDVYLLGGILYEIVTGRAPHERDSLMAIISSVVLSEPELSRDVPPELKRIIERALDPDPHARFENVEQFRLALQGFLRHRDGRRLAERAESRRKELEAMTREAEVNDAAVQEKVYRLFAETRFGFLHALEVSPQNDAARTSLDHAFEMMVDFELAHGEPETASRLVGEMSEPRPGLVERVEAARRKRIAEDDELRRVSADHDPLAGRRTRVFLTSVMGLIWVIFPGAYAALSAFGVQIEHTNLQELGISTFFLAILAGLGIWARDSMSRTAINRTVGLSALLVVIVQIVCSAAGWISDESPYRVIHDGLIAYGVVAAMLAITVDPRLGFSAVGYFVGYVMTTRMQSDAIWAVLAGCNAVLLVNMVSLWSRPEDFEEMRDRVEERQRNRRAWIRSRLLDRD